MRRIVNKVKQDGKMEQNIEKFIYIHTYLSYAIMLFVIPMLLMISVTAFTTVVMIPVSYLCGWC